MPSADVSLSANTPARFETRALVAAGGAALAGVVVYLNSLHNPFVYDDFRTVVDNPSIRSVANVRAIVLSDMMRPVANFSFALDRALWGPTPFGFHLTNLLLHAVNAILLFHLARRLMEDRQRISPISSLSDRRWIFPFASAALFAVHPMMTEAVGYVSGRSEVLAGTLFLLAVLCGRRWMRGDGAVWPILTIGLWATSLATKETSAMLPVVLLACDWLTQEGTAGARRRRAVTVHLPLFSIAIAAALVRLLVLARVEHPGAVTVHWAYVWITLDVARRYLWLLIDSSGQAAFHAVTQVRGLSDPRALLDIGVIAGILVFAWRVREGDPVASFGMLWFFLLLVPSSVLVVLDQGEPMAEHRVYLASCGAFLAAGSAIGWAFRSRASVRMGATTVLVIGLGSLGAQTIARNALWASPVALWRESVNRAPDHYRPRLLLGEALQDAGRRDEAVEEFKTVVRLRPGEPSGYMKLGLCLAEMGRLSEAAVAFNDLRAVDPHSPLASNGLGTVAMLSRQPALARQYFLQTIAADSGNVSARQSLALLGEMEGTDPADVLRLCEEVQRLAPWTPGNDECIRRNRSRLATASPDH